MLIAYVKGVIYSRAQYLTLYNCLMFVSCIMCVECLAISKEHCNLCFSYIADLQTLPLQILLLLLNSRNSSFIFEGVHTYYFLIVSATYSASFSIVLRKVRIVSVL